ncbi:hypothetical protein BN946_scf184920.g48 [Trametes cinnabarina]|uniref:Sm domain-containing protein n=1 Tax=Pycnoporus cinnabarinus TaxID=5643 RepID=A0A060SHS5_PYCCI|nr:hypothetical protein BN946_scf184920.g48 [Trametes cinnabarina]
MSSPPVATVSPRPRTTQPTINLEKLQGMLKQTLRVTVTDGRIFIGTFAGTDKQLNILLISTDEYRVGPDAGADGVDGRSARTHKLFRSTPTHQALAWSVHW